MSDRRPGARGVMQHYRVPDTAGLDAVIADMQRRYTPRATHTTVLEGRTYVSFQFDAPLPSLTERAASFGWQVVIHLDGLPCLPVIAPGTHRRRVGRPIAWSLTVTFEREPNSAALNAICTAADDDPRRRDAHPTASGRYCLYAWRDQGWDGQSWRDLWALIHQHGGRAYEAGDDPLTHHHKGEKTV